MSTRVEWPVDQPLDTGVQQWLEELDPHSWYYLSPRLPGRGRLANHVWRSERTGEILSETPAVGHWCFQHLQDAVLFRLMCGYQKAI